MARIRPQVNPNNPIPNNPFYSPESNYISGVSGPFIVGSGLSINNITGTISSSGGGGGAVSQVIAAAGISVNPSGGTGNVTVSNAGVLSVTAGSGISVSAATGNITISSTSGATVSNVTGTAPISVANGTTTPNVSVATATTTNSGVTTLVDNLSTNDSTKALTAAQGKVLQDQINSLLVSGTIELAGTIDAATGFIASVTTVGAADGYVVGSTLPPASVTTNNTYVIVTTPGTLTPPGGAATPATRGDWFLVSEVTPGNYQWTFLNVGFDAPPATDTVPGIVELATNTETQTGTDATRSVTPASAAATYVPLSAITAKGTLIAGQAPNNPVALPVGTIGQVLQVDPTTTSGLKWVTPAAGCTGTVTQVATGAGLTGGPINTVGTVDLVVQSIAAGSYSSANVTVNCYGVITSIASGAAGIPCACILAKGDLIAGLSANTPTALPVGTDGQILVAASASSTGLCWVTPPALAIPCACITAKGDLIVGASANTPVSLGVGSNGQVLTACSTAPNGVCWTEVPVATPTALGTILGRIDRGSGAVGFKALCSLTTGDYNVGIGESAGLSITSGCRNVAVGVLSVATSTTASDNVGVGTEALRRTTSGFNNVAIGTTTLVFNTTGANNVAVGYDAQRANTIGYQNTAIGAQALAANNTFSQNTAVGATALRSYNGGTNGTNDAFGALAMCSFTTGDYNVSLGAYSLLCYTSGCFNTAVGHRSMTDVTTGTCNTAVGAYSGQSLTTGCFNTAVGYSTQVLNGSNNTVIGYGAQNVSGASNSITLGNSSISVIRAQVTSITALSDARDKTDVTALPVGLDFINSLNPVKFTWQMREPNEVKDGTSEAGFIAQELQTAQKAAGADYLGLVYDEDPEKLEASAGKLIPVLVKAIQELSDQNKALESRLAQLEANG